jgi:hypothetical protein
MVEIKRLSLEDAFPLGRDDSFGGTGCCSGKKLGAREVFPVQLKELAGSSVTEGAVDGFSAGP